MATMRHFGDMRGRYYPIVPGVRLEVVVQTVAEARAAVRAGVSRLELCVDLANGGTTPSVRLTRDVVAGVSVPVFVMIRPRAGDYVYSAHELDAMRTQVDEAIASGAAGLVLGVLQPDRRVDVPRTRALIDRAEGRPVTFHRAFDETPDLESALEDLIQAGASRVLTSGGAATAFDGTPRLAALVRRAGDRIGVLAGGGVRAHNVAVIVRDSGVREVHMRFEDEARTRQVVDLL
jgi:copper homeostasis protein